MEQLQEEIKNTIGETLTLERIKRLVQSSTVERIRFHLEQWPVHKLNQRVPGAGYFLRVVQDDIRPIAPPEKPIYASTEKVAQRNNFEQREYSEEFLESFYVNFEEEETTSPTQAEPSREQSTEHVEQHDTGFDEWAKFLNYQEEQTRLAEYYAYQMRPRTLHQVPDLLDEVEEAEEMQQEEPQPVSQVFEQGDEENLSKCYAHLAAEGACDAIVFPQTRTEETVLDKSTEQEDKPASPALEEQATTSAPAAVCTHGDDAAEDGMRLVEQEPLLSPEEETLVEANVCDDPENPEPVPGDLQEPELPQRRTGYFPELVSILPPPAPRLLFCAPLPERSPDLRFGPDVGVVCQKRERMAERPPPSSLKHNRQLHQAWVEHCQRCLPPKPPPGENPFCEHAVLSACDREQVTRLSQEQPLSESAPHAFLATPLTALDRERVNKAITEQLQGLYEQNKPRPFMPWLPREEEPQALTSLPQRPLPLPQDKMREPPQEAWQLTPAPSPKRWWKGPLDKTARVQKPKPGEREWLKTQQEAAATLPRSGGEFDTEFEEQRKRFYVKDDTTTLH